MYLDVGCTNEYLWYAVLANKWQCLSMFLFHQPPKLAAKLQLFFRITNYFSRPLHYSIHNLQNSLHNSLHNSQNWCKNIQNPAILQNDEKKATKNLHNPDFFCTFARNFACRQRKTKIYGRYRKTQSFRISFRGTTR